MANWSTQLFADYVLSTEDGQDSATITFTVAPGGNGLISVQFGTIGFPVVPKMTLEAIVDSAKIGFTLSPIKSGESFQESATSSFVIFPQSRGGAQVTDLKTTKQLLKNLIIR